MIAQRTLKIGLTMVSLLLCGGLIFFAGGGLPLFSDFPHRINGLEPGDYEIPWMISTGQKIPPVPAALDQWSLFRNWVMYPVRPKGGTLYRLVIEYSPSMAGMYGSFHKLTQHINPPRKSQST